MLRSASGVASLLGLALGVVVPFGTAFAQVDILTERYDDSRSGANLAETALNTSNVNVSTFGKLWSYTVSGSVYAQPLYVHDLAVPGQGTHNVLFVATMNDMIYAFDADSSVDAPALFTRRRRRSRGRRSSRIIDVLGYNDNIIGNVGIEGSPDDRPCDEHDLLRRAHRDDRHRPVRRIEPDIHAAPARARPHNVRRKTPQPRHARRQRARQRQRQPGRHDDVRREDRRPALEHRALERARVHRVVRAQRPVQLPRLGHGLRRGDAAADDDLVVGAGRHVVQRRRHLDGRSRAGIDADGNVYYTTGNGNLGRRDELRRIVREVRTDAGCAAARLVHAGRCDVPQRHRPRSRRLGPDPGSRHRSHPQRRQERRLLRDTHGQHGPSHDERRRHRAGVRQQQSAGSNDQIKGGPVYWNRDGGAGPWMYVWSDGCNHFNAYHFNGTTFDTTPPCRKARCSRRAAHRAAC